MISICIPVYNFNAMPLVNSLVAEAEKLDQPIEIIVIDDGSKPKYKELNASFDDTYQYIDLEKNIGRAAIRNLFLKHVSNEYLLFLDCDCVIISDTFIQKYINQINENTTVICGGRVYPEKEPVKKYRLRWKYGVERESKTAKERKKKPYQSFMTNNFLVKKTILDQIRFDENLVGYGHEDTLFGYELKQNNIPIHHIDNPILNGDIEENTVYLRHTKEAIGNLVSITLALKQAPSFMEDIALLNTYHKLGKLNKVYLFFFKLVKKPMLWSFKKGYVSIFLFNAYKLGIFIEKKQELAQ